MNFTPDDVRCLTLVLSPVCDQVTQCLCSLRFNLVSTISTNDIPTIWGKRFMDHTQLHASLAWRMWTATHTLISTQNRLYQSSDSCDSFLVLLNSYLSNTTCQHIVSANDNVLFADKEASAAWEEMMGDFIGYFDKVSKSFMLDFISLFFVSSPKSEILIERIIDVMLICGIDITKTRFVCFDRASLISGKKSCIQRRYWNDAPFSIMSIIDATVYYILNY